MRTKEPQFSTASERKISTRGRYRRGALFIDQHGQRWESSGRRGPGASCYLVHQPSGIGGYFSARQLARLTAVD